MPKNSKNSPFKTGVMPWKDERYIGNEVVRLEEMSRSKYTGSEITLLVKRIRRSP